MIEGQKSKRNERRHRSIEPAPLIHGQRILDYGPFSGIGGVVYRQNINSLSSDALPALKMMDEERDRLDPEGNQDA